MAAPASRRFEVFGLAASFAGLGLVACGVEGVTPDCAVATVCAPSEGDAIGAADAATDANVERDAGSSDGASDARADEARDATADGG